ncbi:MAG: SGNH/GDSL hydrolase family protein [Myxococcota bacterium]|nr:SGNH/GDSL hydrolase family protein [Myxococcota bacterium]
MSAGKKAVFAGMASLMFFGLVEFGFRLVVSLTSDRLASMIEEYRRQYYSHLNQDLAYRPHPYFGYVRRDSGARDQINSLGFWGPELALEKPESTVRVVALGGSTTAGPRAWPYQLEVVLNEARGEGSVEVQNLGIGGWTSAEALGAFAMVGVSHEPDLVVIHCVNNDMEPMRAVAPEVDYSHYRRAMDVVQTDEGTATFKQDAADLLDALAAGWSDVYVYAKLFRYGPVPSRASLHQLTTWTPPTQPEPSEKGVAIFERNLRSIAAIAQANGAAVMLTSMPALQTKRPGIPSVPDGHLRSLDAQNRRLQALAQREGWLFADLAALADDLTPHFEDAIHVDARGERMKAVAIAEVIAAAGLFESAPSAAEDPSAEEPTPIPAPR